MGMFSLENVMESFQTQAEEYFDEMDRYFGDIVFYKCLYEHINAFDNLYKIRKVILHF